MKKHWTRFLPDNYMLKHESQSIESLMNEVDRLRGLLATAEINLMNAEHDIFWSAKKDYSLEEITNAKQEAKCSTI